jgi:hypothetical protein
MRREDLKRSFDSIEPGRDAENRMLNNILHKSKKARGTASGISFTPRKAMPVMAIALVLVAGIAIWSLSSGNLLTRNAEDGRISAGDSIGSAPREDFAAVLKDQFQLGDRHYIVLHDEQRVGFGLPETITEEDIGEKLATISESIDESLIGFDVYRYMPAGGEAVVAVKRETGYQLFRFFAFESYLNNQDEDTRDYLELYGISGADDIARILFIGHSEQAKIEGRMDILTELTDRQKIRTFYDYYSVIPNSSDKYFEKLFNFEGNDRVPVDTVPDPAIPEPDGTVVHPVPPDYMDGEFYDMPAAPDHTGWDAVPGSSAGNEAAPADYADDAIYHRPVESNNKKGMSHQGETTASYEGRSGTDALASSITIRIYNKNGVYFETVYYPNIGFISRHEVKDEFAAFLKNCLAQ